MDYIQRSASEDIHRALSRGKSILLLGPRQTGKTTLLKRFPSDLSISLVQANVRQRYERTPDALRLEVEHLRRKPKTLPLIIIDEIQKVPALMDGVQDLIDRQQARFILSGSSARKLKRGAETNLLPGRVVQVRLDPLMLSEDALRPLEMRLCDGDLPGILQGTSAQDREADLASYVTTYLEEEVRAESIVRNLASFSRFLELAAVESGNIVNLRRISQDVGVAHTTIASYYDILVDCLIAERVEPYTVSPTRKKLTRSPRMLIFDMGVRRVAANEGRRPPREKWGAWFESWVGLELIRATRAGHARHPLHFWRDPGGPEVDWVLDMQGTLIPVECKWSESPNASDARHLETFIMEYRQARRGYVVCRSPRRMTLSPHVEAIPWQDLRSILA